ncbi:MAG TPA: B12-binding domain-containing protein [Phycisphaerae bacterium]|nr:B12-binding domain-containing protein [Phycisphaerae bacterium]HRW52506.1 B12-binding domain-containing protein [Phycisphaerae bacterium]
MNRETANHVADTIENVARALAEWTVNRHLKSDPALPDKYGEYWRSDWVGHVESRFRFLAQAVALNRPEVFAAALQWTAEAHCGHEENIADLDLSLRCMREVVREEAPTAALDAVNRCIDAALNSMECRDDTNRSSLSPDRPHDRLTLSFVEAILSADDSRAARMIFDAAGSGTSVKAIYCEALQPAMREIGILWHRGDISVAEEHLATATTRDVMARLRTSFPETPQNAPRVLAAAVAGDFHDLGLRMAADLLELEGWRAWFLGANVPADVLIEFLDRWPTQLLLLSASTALHLRSAAKTIETIRNVFPASQLRVLVGGTPFSQIEGLWRDIGADGCGATLGDTPSAAAELFESTSN